MSFIRKTTLAKVASKFEVGELLPENGPEIVSAYTKRIMRDNPLPTL